MPAKELLEKLQAGEQLSADETKRCMDGIMDGLFSEEAVTGLLTLMQKNGITADEIAGARRSMMQRATPIRLDDRAVDTCGTGGDSAGTFNISTAAALVATAAGACVAKHGNRSITSRCGSADVLEELGIEIELPPEATEELYRRTGFAYLHAPLYHPSMKAVADIRRKIGTRTIFNILGPLMNPAGVTRQMVGVFDRELMDLYAEALLKTGCRHALIVHGETETAMALDEPSICGRTHIIELHNGERESHTVRPTEFHLHEWPLEEIRGGSREENAEIIRLILDNKAPEAHREAAIFAGAIACYVGGVANCIDEGVCMAREAIAHGTARRNTETIIEASRELKARYR
ncbi:anthranilate phosphoribosyltransferase [Chlorobium sp. N1]|uniref:anthranilate phosphoribosyltransferase n=1 Tax=Chlorobium sp. N1 TaxID=2491138 RepID=UPI0010390E98|nr:anthranilate phosphoribosyltransferase [Chlorobium sp. N1]TCD48733.1 anthranilate phosphoribosyltransferase [Chlorobium sp. N1]